MHTLYFEVLETVVGVPAVVKVCSTKAVTLSANATQQYIYNSGMLWLRARSGCAFRLGSVCAVPTPETRKRTTHQIRSGEGHL
eukprot:m.191665 g.191665  ORF g.191665 m.191665 type:complete len:83 (+) comp24933_c0_seq2:611-859(+)